MTLQQLQYIDCVAKCCSISDAAKQLFVSQPRLSKTIKELESELGFSIFIRSNRGIRLSPEGGDFLIYVRQVLSQSELLEEKYFKHSTKKQRFSLSTQHYSFAVNAFVNLLKKYGTENYDFRLRETRTDEIIEDVQHLRSEIGILFLDDFNRDFITKLLTKNELTFTKLTEAKPHIFISKNNPLSCRNTVTLKELTPYPCLSFEQGENPLYFSEEPLSSLEHTRSIKVRDRATLFNLVIGLNGYTISSGIIDPLLNGNDIISVPLRVDEIMEIGYITHNNTSLSALANEYLSQLRNGDFYD